MISTIFLILVLYQVKHFIADYPLQASKFMLGKFKDDWGFLGPLAAHASVHGAMTFAIAFVFTHALPLAIYLALLDSIIHFAMDRLKAGKKYMGRWKPLSKAEWLEQQELVAFAEGEETATHRVGARLKRVSMGEYRGLIRIEAKGKLRGNMLFWWAVGIDQAVHHLTHYLCIWFIIQHLL